MAKFFQFIVLPLFVTTLNAQQEGRMETDRPDQTESPFITKHKYFQGEVGLSLAKEKGYSTIAIPTVLWKYGLLKKFELRLITEINVVETPLIIPDGNKINSGLVPIQIGGKLSLWEEKGLLPKTSLLFHVAIPKVAAKKFQVAKWAPSFVFSMQHTLSKTVGIGYNLGAEWDGESNTAFGVYTLSSGFNMGERWYSYIELFGAIRKNDLPQNIVDGGLGYYINDDLKIDASAGIGISDAAIDHFFGVGISFRFH
jgi:hypothetical protein